MESSRKICDLMKAQLAVYKEIESQLENIVNNKQGSIWAHEQVNEINALFNRLKSLDKQRNEIAVNNVDYKINPELLKMADELKIIIINIKRYMGVLQARIEGGQQHVLSSIKSVIKNMEIKGYKNNVMMESKMCIS